MKFLNPIYMTLNMTAFITILNIHFALFCLMKSDGVNRMFHLQNETLVNRVQDMSQKVINLRVFIRFVGNLNEIAQYLKFFMCFPGVTIMTLAS